jgi:hypothetical protein
MASECFCPQGAKKITPQKATDRKWQQFEKNHVWHVSCIGCFYEDFVQRTWNLLRAIWRSAHGANTAGYHDLQLTCQ